MGDNTVRSQMSIIATCGLTHAILNTLMTPGPISYQSHVPTDRKNTIDTGHPPLPLSLSIVHVLHQIPRMANPAKHETCLPPFVPTHRRLSNSVKPLRTTRIQRLLPDSPSSLDQHQFSTSVFIDYNTLFRLHRLLERRGVDRTTSIISSPHSVLVLNILMSAALTSLVVSFPHRCSISLYWCPSRISTFPSNFGGDPGPSRPPSFTATPSPCLPSVFRGVLSHRSIDAQHNFPRTPVLRASIFAFLVDHSFLFTFIPPFVEHWASSVDRCVKQFTGYRHR
jgi:hypothetical protein